MLLPRCSVGAQAGRATEGAAWGAGTRALGGGLGRSHSETLVVVGGGLVSQQRAGKPVTTLQ